MIADSTKPVDAIGSPIPLELFPFGLKSTLARIGDEIGPVEIRADTPPSPDGGVIADLLAEVKDPAELAAALSAVPGRRRPRPLPRLDGRRGDRRPRRRRRAPLGPQPTESTAGRRG